MKTPGLIGGHRINAGVCGVQIQVNNLPPLGVRHAARAFIMYISNKLFS